MTLLVYSLGFTGHRPQKLGGYFTEASDRVDRFAAWWLSEWERLNPQLLPVCHVGMAQGWDMAIARACVALKVPFVAHLPASGAEAQCFKWPSAARLAHRALLSYAYAIKYGPPSSSFVGELNARNGSIIDSCQTLYALWDGSPGGTGNCVRDAIKAGKPVTNVWDLYSNSP